MSSIETLEKRIAALEDRLAIYQLVASFGPAADSCEGAVISNLWLEDGTYETGHKTFAGAAEVGNVVETEMHRQFLEPGCAHVLSLPVVTVDGDRAIATGYSRVYQRDGDQWRVARASANRWELERRGAGWKVARRINRMLDGSGEGPEGRALLARAFEHG